mgnify:CR=1 FL=1|jgi:hypothetical protein
MKKITQLRLVFFVSFLLFQCDAVNSIIFRYYEMQCEENSWGNAQLETEWSDDARTYLTTEGVNVIDIQVTVSTDPVCTACSICPTGRSINVWIEESDANLIESLGFHRVE